jgi:hypothetical protein
MDNNSCINNDIKKMENYEQEDYQDILINKSNITYVFMTKIFFIINIVLIFAIMIFISYKFKYILSFNRKFSRFFSDISVMTNRYALIYYYFNTLRTLILLPDGSSFKIIYTKAMDNLNEVYEKENKKYMDLLSSNIGDYKEINKLFNVLKETNEDKFNEIKNIICNKIEFCENYMD